MSAEICINSETFPEDSLTYHQNDSISPNFTKSHQISPNICMEFTDGCESGEIRKSVRVLRF